MKKIAIFTVFICLSVLLSACQQKSMNPNDFDSEISILNKNIENFSKSLPDKTQHFTFSELTELKSTYEMKYKFNDEISLLLIFNKDNEKLESISFGNIEEKASYKYSNLGIVPTALMLTILNGDVEDDIRKQVSEFLINCKKDEQITIEDDTLGKIKMIKESKSQIIKIYFND